MGLIEHLGGDYRAQGVAGLGRGPRLMSSVALLFAVHVGKKEGGPRGAPIVTGLSPGCRASGMAPGEPRGHLPSGCWDAGRWTGNAAWPFWPLPSPPPAQPAWERGAGGAEWGAASSAPLPRSL